jgi:type IV secretory pathway VirB10-like protein
MASPRPLMLAPPAPIGPMMEMGGARRSAPALVVDFGDPDTVARAAANAANAAVGINGRPSPTLSGDEQFAARVGTGETERVRATFLRNKSATVPQGAMIPAVLETALNSDLPGLTRAVVSGDVRSFDGSQVLIPRGSRLIGQYRSGVALGASRAFVIWTRVLRPDGASVQIGSSGTDPLGRAGLAGSVDRHFYERFGGAILLSVVNAGATALVGRPATQVVIGSSSDAGALAASASSLSSQAVSPTINVPQGTPIRVFVARDLDFTPVESAQ